MQFRPADLPSPGAFAFVTPLKHQVPSLRQLAFFASASLALFGPLILVWRKEKR